MENKEMRMKNGGWGMENKEMRMRNGELGMEMLNGNGVWENEMGNWKWEMKNGKLIFFLKFYVYYAE